MYSSGCPVTHFLEQDDLEFRDSPASAFWDERHVPPKLPWVISTLNSCFFLLFALFLYHSVFVTEQHMEVRGQHEKVELRLSTMLKLETEIRNSSEQLL